MKPLVPVPSPHPVRRLLIQRIARIMARRETGKGPIIPLHSVPHHLEEESGHLIPVPASSDTSWTSCI